MHDPKSASAVLKKIAIDQLVYAPVFTCILYMYLQIAHGEADTIVATLQVRSPHFYTASISRVCIPFCETIDLQ